MTMNEKPLDRIVRSTLGLMLLAIVLFLIASPIALIEGTILLAIGIPGVLLLSTGHTAKTRAASDTATTKYFSKSLS